MRVLMMGQDWLYMQPDIELLKSYGFRVYACVKWELFGELIAEVKPDIAFINPQDPNEQIMEWYHQLLDNVAYVSLPVIFTLSKADVYVVNRKRTEVRERRWRISDHILGAVRQSLFLHSVSGRWSDSPTLKERALFNSYRA